MPGGIFPLQLGPHGGVYGGLAFWLGKRTVAGTATYQLFPNGNPFPRSVRVMGMMGIMTGAGAAADTVQLQDKDSNAITEAVDVSALSDQDKWDCSVVNDAYYEIKPGDNLKIATASGALSEVWVQLMLMNSEDLP